MFNIPVRPLTPRARLRPSAADHNCSVSLVNIKYGTTYTLAECQERNLRRSSLCQVHSESFELFLKAAEEERLERTWCRVACWLKDVCAVLTGERRTVSGRYVQCRCACLPVSFSCRGCVSLPLNTNSLVVASAACPAALFKQLPKVGGVVGLFCFFSVMISCSVFTHK